MAELSSSSLAGSTSMQGRLEFAGGWREQSQRLQKGANVFYFAFKHPGTPWYARSIAACLAAYLLSPIQIIPNYIPVIGMLDDLVVVFLGVRLLRRIIPAYVLMECRGLADAAELRRRAEIKSTASVVSSLAIATVWMVGAFIGSALVAAYFYR
jgi:uncharacterized membrane protein YkvA (DUF1232 family)